MLIVRFNCYPFGKAQARKQLKSGVQVSIMIFFAGLKVEVNPS